MKRWLKMIAVLLLALAAKDNLSPLIARADDGNTSDFGSDIWDPQGGYKRGDDVFSYQWNGLKDRFAGTFKSPAGFFGTMLLFGTGLWEILLAIQLIAEFLCWAFGWFCADSGANAPPPGAKPPYCADSTGSPITSADRAAQCCMGANLDQPQNPLSAACKPNFPAQELATFPSSLAAAAYAAHSEMGAAAALISGRGTAATPTGGGGPLATGQSDAATAGNIAPMGQPTPQGATNISIGGLPVAPAAQSNSGSGLSASGDSGLGGLAATSAAADGSLSSPTPDLSANGGVYSGGQGTLGNGANGASSPFGSQFGAHGNAGSGVNQVDLGAQAGTGDSGSVQGANDPSDYFSRIGIEDDIFKIVTRRYIKKATGWVLDVGAAPVPAAAH
jgi:hypothetical protein